MADPPRTPRPKVKHNIKPHLFDPVAPRKGAAKRLWAPREFEATWENVDGLRVVLNVEIGNDGLPYCVGLAIKQIEGGQPIIGQTLREISLPRLMRAALDEVTGEAEPLPGGGWRYDFPPVERSRTAITRGHLEEVARRYKAAHDRGDPPTYSVAKEMGVSRATAARWVGKARNEELLGPALPGQAGEAEK